MCWTIIFLTLLPTVKSKEMEFLLRKIPDVEILMADSSVTPISKWYKQKPVILTFAYSRCPGVCNPYLLQVRDHVLLQDLDKDLFQVLVLSFDAKDEPAQLQKMAGFNKDAVPQNWAFGILTEEKSKQNLLSSVGVEVKQLGELFNHNPVMILLNTEGKIVQRIEGLPDNGQWNRLLKEVNNEWVPVYLDNADNVWASCFKYDPADGKWRMNWGMLLILGPSLVTVIIIIFLQWATSRSRKKHIQSLLISKP